MKIVQMHALCTKF